MQYESNLKTNPIYFLGFESKIEIDGCMIQEYGKIRFYSPFFYLIFISYIFHTLFLLSKGKNLPSKLSTMLPCTWEKVYEGYNEKMIPKGTYKFNWKGKLIKK